MNIKNIRALAQILESSGLTALEVTEGETVIRLEKTPAAVSQQMPRTEIPTIPMAPLAPAPVAGAASLLGAGASVPTAAAPGGVVDFNDLTEVKSPMVGIYYNSPSPDASPFIKVGDRVKKGDVLCIIEAMKLMNEITAEADGEIVDICAENGQLVEFGQCLFKLY